VADAAISGSETAKWWVPNMDEVKLNAITIERWHGEEEMTWGERGGIAGFPVPVEDWKGVEGRGKEI
jgi:hypothetical protein